MMLPGYVLEEEEMSMEHLTETEKIYQQSVRWVFHYPIYIYWYIVSRIMCEHDANLPGLNKIPIVCASVNVDESDTVGINGKKYSINTIEKKNFEDTRKILNTNTLRSNVTKKAPELAKNMSAIAKHTEIRLLKLVNWCNDSWGKQSKC